MANRGSDSPPHPQPESQQPSTSDVPAGEAVRPDRQSTAGAGRQKPTGQKQCRYFNTSAGCRAGSACPFKHDPNPPTKRPTKPSARARPPPSEQTPTAATSSQQARRYPPPTVPNTKVVPRPIPAAQLSDPREFQLGQIRRRFGPTTSQTTDGSADVFNFKLRPSDPDFPYEIEALECVLTVPRGYPGDGRPRLRAVNKEMQRGFQINVEQGFDEIAARAPDATLLGLMNRLDKALADVLSRPMAETVKLVSHARPVENRGPVAAPIVSAPASAVSAHREAAPSFTQVQRDVARLKRQGDIRQLVARLGKASGFSQSGDGITFTLPFTVFRTANAPAGIKNATSLQLIVPELFDLVPCRVRFTGTRNDEMENVEAAFLERTSKVTEPALLAHVNYLSQNMGIMAAPSARVATTEAVAQQPTTQQVTENQRGPSSVTKVEGEVASDKPHIKIIPRPLEWSQDASPSDSDSDDSFTDDSDSATNPSDDEDATNEGDPHAVVRNQVTGTAEKGILLSFPNLELHGIELLELTQLSLTVKCDRCKDARDFERLANNVKADHTGMKEEGCRKCASSLAAGFRMDLMHASSSRAGYIDLDGCTALDLLPSTFVPTCAECSTAYTNGCTAVRGDSAMAVCRECHQKMSFRICEVKFLRVSAAAERATQGPTRRKVKENLSIVAGQELPRRGRCQHYAKSFRWFRFSCCARVYPCDRCHDEANPDHNHEFANRMLCGFCSREQNYRPEDCGVCHSILIGKKGHGFWEGGKGTRDRTRMSRKDPRKYKRRPGTVVGGSKKT